MSNANKKFLSIDMKSDGGRELVEKLLEQADVFVTSLRNPSLRRLGYDYETLHARYPRLVYGPNARLWRTRRHEGRQGL